MAEETPSPGEKENAYKIRVLELEVSKMTTTQQEIAEAFHEYRKEAKQDHNALVERVSDVNLAKIAKNAVDEIRWGRAMQLASIIVMPLAVAIIALLAGGK